jgi:hypothetical protein
MVDVAAMSSQEKIAECLRRSLPLMPSEARRQVEAMVSPESLAIVSGTILVWGGSHIFGIGEVVDLILLAVGFALLGGSIFAGARELYDFCVGAVNAHEEPDLDAAARHFSIAIGILGISTISAVLFRGSARAVVVRGRPQVRAMPNVGPPPQGIHPRITRPLSLPAGQLGETDWWGSIAVARRSHRHRPVADVRPMMTEEEAIARAKDVAREEGWAWVDPVLTTWRPRWFKAGGRWEVLSNARSLGAKVRVLIDAGTGSVLEKGYIPR